MQILLTGGTGFVGGHLVRQLCGAGDRVRALLRPAADARPISTLGAEPVRGDLEDSDSLRGICDGCEIVYHAAARVDTAGTEHDFFRTTVQGTENLLTAAAAAGVRRFVYVSSCGVYHPRLFKSGLPVDEFTPTPAPPRWFRYARAKLRAEGIVQRLCPPSMEWVIIRLGYLYGPGNRAMHTHLAPALADTTMHILGDGENEIGLIYVEDAVRAVVLAGRSGAAAGRILIAGGTERITQKQYFDALTDGFGLPRVRRRMPYTIAYFFGWLGEHLIRSGPRRATLRRASVALTGLPQRISCEHTQRLLNWRPEVPFAEGIRAAFEWYEREYGSRGAGGR